MPLHEKIGFLAVQKQRRRSAVHLLSPHLFSLHNFSSTYTQNFKILAFFCGLISRFVSDMVGNPEDWFSRFAAQNFML